MKCQYPNCHQTARWTPIVELPTVRSVGDSLAMVRTDQPTILLCREVCEHHKQTYNLAQWINEADWQYIREAARESGYAIPSIELVTVQFRPVGWHPRNTIPIERSM